MKVKKISIVCIVIVLVAGIFIYCNWKRVPNPTSYRKMALDYLEQHKIALDGAEPIPLDISEEDGRVISMHMWHPDMVDKVIPLIENAVEMREVETIPELTYPLVYIGNRMIGNNEKLYYFDAETQTVIEFSLSHSDALAFLLYITSVGTPYPTVKEAFTEGIISKLKSDIIFADHDILTFSNGYLESVDIKTPETAEMLFSCIRNCKQITDLTDMSLKPMALPVEINGYGTGTFDTFFYYADTGQYVSLSFDTKDAEDFYNYIISLNE